MSVRNFIEINQYPWNKGKKTASVCFGGMCGSMQSSLKWANRYINKDVDFASKVLEDAIKEQKRVRNVIKRFNRRFG